MIAIGLTLSILGIQTQVVEKSSPGSEKSSVPKEWSSEFKVEQFPRTTPLLKFAYDSVFKVEKDRYELFIKEARKDWEDLRKEGFQNEYSYDSEAKVRFRNSNLVSILAGTSTYHGGAHGITFSNTFNFGLIKGKPKLLKLSDFSTSTASERKIRKILWSKIKKHPDTLWVQDGTVKSLNETQYQRFWVGQNCLIWEFDPYELSAYAYGPFSFSLSWKELKGLIKPEFQPKIASKK